MDGLRVGASTSFGVNHSGVLESSFCLREPRRVFTSEMSAIFVALIQIRARRPVGRYLIVTESMSSLRALQTRKVAPRYMEYWYMKWV
jgi:hypothetical protein